MNVGIFLALDWTFVIVIYLMILFQILQVVRRRHEAETARHLTQGA